MKISKVLVGISLFIKIFILLFIMLFVVPLMINGIFTAMNSNIIPRGNAVQVYNDYIKNSDFLIKFVFLFKKIILFM